jgi:hypothetical protein
MQFIQRNSTIIVVVTTLTLLYVGSYTWYVHRYSNATFQAGPDCTEIEWQMIWERYVPYRNNGVKAVFQPLEWIDRRIRPQFWDWEEIVPDSELQEWLKDKRMQ